MDVSSLLTAGMGDKQDNGDLNVKDYLSSLPHDQWILINTSGWRPSARYKHAAEIVQEKLYVIGGSRNGRYLSDIQVFNCRTFKWSKIDPNMDSNSSASDSNATERVFPAMAGHSVVKYENKLLVVAGHSKEPSDAVTVWSIDPETQACSLIKTQGEAPAARGGQSVTLVGSRLIMFGGEDTKRQLLNDLHILDLNTLTWELGQAKKKPPSPRFDHTAVAHFDRYLLIFGGSSHSTCFNDLHVLDLDSNEWSQPETQGASVAPRGGHASASIDGNWYIVGGGDNKSGATETIVLNMSKLVWSVATVIGERDPLASEGLTLCSTTVEGETFLMAYGGYNGKYSNELFVLKPKPRDMVRPKIFQSPAAAAAAASVTAAYALTRDKKKDPVDTLDANHNGVQIESLQKIIAVDVDQLITEKDTLQSKLVELVEKNARLKGNLDEMNNSHTLLSMELQSVQGQLTAERSRCLKLEVEIADIQEKLESLNSIGHELEVLRQQKSQVEGELALVQKQGSRSGRWW